MCGIFGQINDKYSNFNYTTFCTLGVVNDARGGDSVGIFIDGKYEYGIDKTKHFNDFMCSSKLLNKIEKCKIAFGHCRKTSVGVTSLETAQPVIICKKKQVEYVLMHNGTIYNTDELAQKYIPNVDIKGMSDSQVMAHIFYAGHYEALEEYNGSAVFAIIDYRKSTTNPTILFFKGTSKKSEYCKNAEEERPLYFTNYNGTMFFSSIESILDPIFRMGDVYELNPNLLCEYRDDDMYIVKEYDRSKCLQNKIVPVVQSCNSYYNNPYPNQYLGNKKNKVMFGEYRPKNDIILPDPYGVKIPEFSSYLGITKLKEWESVDVGLDLLYYQKYKSNLLQGGVNISEAGFVSSDETNYCKKYWFWQGIMLKNKACFDYLLKIQYELNVDEMDLLSVYPELIASLAVLPFYITETGIYIDGYKDEIYNGNVIIPFSRREIEIKDGKNVKSNIDTVIHSGVQLFEKYKDYNPLTDDVVLELSK